MVKRSFFGLLCKKFSRSALNKSSHFAIRDSFYYFCSVFESFWRGQQVPSFIIQLMTELRHAIEELVEKHLPDESHFVVEVKLEEKAGKTRVLILIDSDQGVTIAACAKVSRAVSEELEAKEIVGEAYVLEVSSPGLDFPLSSRRQYQKNIGRELKMTLTSGSDVTGKLLEVEVEKIKLLVKKKEKGKKATEEEVFFPFEEIKKSIVQVSFK